MFQTEEAKGMCKGPVIGGSVACLRNHQKVIEDEIQSRRWRESGLR